MHKSYGSGKPISAVYIVDNDIAGDPAPAPTQTSNSLLLLPLFQSPPAPQGPRPDYFDNSAKVTFSFLAKQNFH